MRARLQRHIINQLARAASQVLPDLSSSKRRSEAVSPVCGEEHSPPRTPFTLVLVHFLLVQRSTHRSSPLP